MSDCFPRRFLRRSGIMVAVLAFCSTTGQAEGPRVGEDAAVEAAYLRVAAESDKSVALEIAATDFAPAEGSGPKVCLVGAVHIGGEKYYQAVQALLDRYEVVLYESVKPAGTGSSEGVSDSERSASTRAALQFVAQAAEAHHHENGRYPADLEELLVFAAKMDPRMSQFLDAAMIDGWGRPIVYECCRVLIELEAEGKPIPRLVSYGSDGKPGGEGHAADLETAAMPAALALTGGEDNLQSELAMALNLEFQLDAIDYGRPNWRCSDMSFDEIDREMTARGLDIGVLEGTLAGSSLPAKIVKLLLGMIRFADSFTEGAASDTIKILLIEMLGDESVMEMSLNQFDPGFTEVIIDQRNQVVIDDLARLIEHEPEVGSVAVFYGAGHLPDLAQRLEEQLGYRSQGPRWLTAIEVNLAESAVSEREVRQLRLMIKRSLRQMSRMQGR